MESDDLPLYAPFVKSEMELVTISPETGTTEPTKLNPGAKAFVIGPVGTVPTKVAYMFVEVGL